MFFERIVDVTHPDGTGTQEVQSIDVQTLVVNALAAYAGSAFGWCRTRTESETDRYLQGSIGSAFRNRCWSWAAFDINRYRQFIRNRRGFSRTFRYSHRCFCRYRRAGTLAGNVFGSDDDEPSAWANSRYDYNKNEYEVSGNWAHAGGDAAIAANMAQQVVDGINNIIGFDAWNSAPWFQSPQFANWLRRSNEFIVSVGGSQKSLATPADAAIMHGAFKALKSFGYSRRTCCC